ncbi:class I SAM-dependent methyltransferase [Streptomyces olivoreticuli]|uniref:class I SAM-dependent methyltransferase n=1 Tax=Streptomyces olivoreticuli TaxID=68246 RepID=UPI000E268D05|nr:class I SAM-dependent methyltransferase [Streptomyces olivoreticuli]
MEAVTAAWERYAADRTPRRERNAAGAATWLNWTQHADHGPDESLLGEIQGRRVLELGCGTGCNLAHLATLGAECAGVDIAPTQRQKAEARWGHLPGLTFHTAEVTEFLARHPGSFDVVLSIFGPVWFIDPEQLLPLVRDCLTPRGVFAFSHKPPRADRQAGGTLREARAVSRWDYSADQWANLLAAERFANIQVEVIPPPDDQTEGTLLVRAEA